jgi:hypothetical protein
LDFGAPGFARRFQVFLDVQIAGTVAATLASELALSRCRANLALDGCACGVSAARFFSSGFEAQPAILTNSRV